MRRTRFGRPGAFAGQGTQEGEATRTGRAFWIETRIAGEDHVWLVRRAGKGMLGGMRALPDDGWAARQDGHGEDLAQGPWEPAGRVAHIFSHFALDLRLAIHAGASPPEDLGEGEWWPLEKLDDAGLPTLFAKAARLALAHTGEDA
ncbi:hypothetical protein MBENS4_1883 [Novosphingobium sp. MBES04]|nr:hypothetical protein MBENS4_1883 [Novosphingobium sp. MBES04]